MSKLTIPQSPQVTAPFTQRGLDKLFYKGNLSVSLTLNSFLSTTVTLLSLRDISPDRGIALKGAPKYTVSIKQENNGLPF